MTSLFTNAAKDPHLINADSDALAKYTPEEREMIERFILDKICQASTHETPDDARPTVIFVGGMLGAGKSHMGYQISQEHSDALLVDVNDVCLCQLEGYIDDYNANGFHAAYNKWREASNYIAMELTKIMTRSQRSFTTVGTATGAHIPGQIGDLLQRGYQVEIMGCVTSPEISRENIKAKNRFGYLSTPPAAAFELPEEHLEKNKEWSARAIYFKQLALENPSILFEQYVLHRGPDGRFEHVLAFKVENGVFVELDHGACQEFDKICLEVNHGPYKTALTPPEPRVA